MTVVARPSVSLFLTWLDNVPKKPYKKNKNMYELLSVFEGSLKKCLWRVCNQGGFSYCSGILVSKQTTNITLVFQTRNKQCVGFWVPDVMGLEQLVKLVTSYVMEGV